MKRLLALLLTVAMLLSLAACGDKGSEGSIAEKLEQYTFPGDGEDPTEASTAPVVTEMPTSEPEEETTAPPAEVVIVTQPVDKTVKSGQNAVFSVVANNATAYQWYYRENANAKWKAASAQGNKTDTLTVPGTESRNGFHYYCQVTGASGTVNSNSVILTVSVESAKPTEPPTEETTPKPVEGDVTIEANLWTLSYQSKDGWVKEDSDFTDNESNSRIMLTIPDPEDEKKELINVEIRVFKGDPYTFRGWLDSYGFDQYDYAVNKSYKTVKVGGIDCLKHEGTYWGSPAIRYFNRVEGAKATVFIEIYGECQDARVASLLSGLSIKLTDVGNVDGPWYWNGTPFSAEPGSGMAGTFTINTQWVPFAECIMTKETFDHAVAASGNKVFLLSEGVLKRYAFDGTKLTYESDIALSDEYENISAASDGSLWLGSFMNPLIQVKDGTVAATYKGTDKVTMHPSGTWGISWFSDPECEKFDLSGGAYSATAITFAGVKTVSRLMIDENNIYVCGYSESDGKHRVFVYNAAGELQMTLDDADGKGLGSVTFITKTANGFIALDGNMRKVVLWNAEGTFIGEIDDADLFGTSYPWFCGATKLNDGSILVIMTEERADKSAKELVAFKLTGF